MAAIKHSPEWLPIKDLWVVSQGEEPPYSRVILRGHQPGMVAAPYCCRITSAAFSAIR
jgi:hypothetical protein